MRASTRNLAEARAVYWPSRTTYRIGCILILYFPSKKYSDRTSDVLVTLDCNHKGTRGHLAKLSKPIRCLKDVRKYFFQIG